MGFRQVSVFSLLFESNILNHPRLRRYTALVHEDLTQTYSRDVQKWLLLAPIVGIATGLVTSAITIIILQISWAQILPFYLSHHSAIIPGLLVGFVLTGLIMQFRTPDPNEHSTEEIIRSYHENQGDIDTRPFFLEIARRSNHSRLWRQCCVGRTEHLRRRRDRIVVVAEASPVWT